MPVSDEYGVPTPRLFPGQCLVEVAIRTGGEHPRAAMFATGVVCLDGLPADAQRDLFEDIVAKLAQRLMDEHMPLDQQR